MQAAERETVVEAEVVEEPLVAKRLSIRYLISNILPMRYLLPNQAV